jgi:hypothetical protein
MQTLNTNQTTRSNDPGWVFLSEYSLRTFLEGPDAGDELATGMQSKMARELAIPVECIHHVEKTLRSFTREAVAQSQLERTDLYGRIRIFCQKKMIEDACSAKTTRLHHIEQAIGEERAVRYSDLIVNGGWGYFLVERTSDSSASPSGGPSHFIDLYLYVEGE